MGYWRDSDTAHRLESSNGRNASRRILLFCLLLMIGCSSCNRSGQEKSQDAGGGEQVEKMPLPRHVEGPPAVAPQEKKPAAPATSEAGKPGSPEAAPAAKQAPPPRAEGKKATTTGAEGKKPLSAKGVAPGQKGAAPATGEAKGPGQGDKSKVATGEKTTPSGAVTKPAAAAKKQATAPGVKKTPAPAVTAPGGRWTVVIGPYLLEETLASDLTKVRKAGLGATIQSTVRKKAAMNRLFLTQFDDRAAAQAELDKLKRYTSDAFILEHGGRHAVYAGSYLLDSRAQSEKERLAAAGFNLTLKRSDVAIPSRRLVVGTYHDRIAAENVQKKLKGAGLKGTLVRH
jgi:cell division septation protein DedD